MQGGRSISVTLLALFLVDFGASIIVASTNPLFPSVKMARVFFEQAPEAHDGCTIRHRSVQKPGKD
jgi:hypothetical protein